jgi:hypothetical protein
MRASTALLALGCVAAGAVAEEAVVDGTAAEPSSSSAAANLPSFTVSHSDHAVPPPFLSELARWKGQRHCIDAVSPRRKMLIRS